MRTWSSALLLAACAMALPDVHAAKPPATPAATPAATRTATPVPAWTRVGKGANPAVYVDLASVKEDRGGRSAWTMRNDAKGQSTPDGKPYRSVRAQYLFACSDHTATLQAQAFYPDAMGKGEAISNFKYEQYDAEKIAAGSAMDSVARRVCRKKLRRR